jgi:MerR family transcriptional regulator, redox-sensitive transcriptional activator SoxR
MTIGELSSEAQVPASTIRYWEQIGVLPKPLRVSGQRRYGFADVNRLAVLRLGQSCGFRLDELRHLLHGFHPDVPASKRWQALALQKRAELDQQMRRLRAMRTLVDGVLKCRCAELGECGRLARSAFKANEKSKHESR